ncbi:FG-GAP repeat domain-containing protein [Haliangium ochraceum]|uniref:FG-GAP repeat protein n=1 Tax=Haliangium ochraceum (strain DSM 14365 / JCM 11303 / SMP-2) TaxID=502025 RepID=D0LID2_HALO1|nr:VCBS repeat-containing protein [Haliangium ochraceum]ACY16511.1 FG-GAP repeat protein [Haliangium ochraceum DSM 14365]
MRSLTIPVVALGLCASAGCTDIPTYDLSATECGNAFVEAGEDCDTYLPEGLSCHPNDCYYVCEPGAEPAACPTGWACGLDGRCWQPSDSFDFDALTTADFSSANFSIGDVDGNGRGEVLATSNSDVLMLALEGSPRAGTARLVASSEPTPESLGPTVFGQFDGDDTTDAVVLTEGALFSLLGQPSALEFSPVVYGSLPVATSGGLRVVAVEAFVGDADREILAMTETNMVFFEAGSTVGTLYPQGKELSDMGRDVGVGDFDTGGESVGEEVAIVFDGESVVHICKATIAGNDESSLQAQCSSGDRVPLDNPVDASGGVRFADVNDDGFLDLMVSVTVDGKQRVEVVFRLSDGGLQNELPDLYTRTGTGVGAATDRDKAWPLAVGDINGDGLVDYVFEDGVAITTRNGTGVPQAFSALFDDDGDTRWLSAVIADFDGDDEPDVVAGFSGGNGGHTVRFLRNDLGGSGVPFTELRNISLAYPPRELRSGDFDGDNAADIAAIDGARGDELVVMFGGGAPERVSMGRFGPLVVFEAIRTSIGPDGFDNITDLVTAFEVATSSGPLLLANFLRGDPLRRMVSPFFLFNIETDEFDQPRGAALGDFFRSSENDFSDFLVVAEKADAAPSQHVTWLLRGTGAGGLVRVGEPLAIEGDEIDYRCAEFLSGDFDPKQDGDEMLIVDTLEICNESPRMPRLQRIARHSESSQAVESVSLFAGVSDVPEAAEVRSARVVDLNNDRYPELLLLLTLPNEPLLADQKQTMALVLWNDPELGLSDSSPRSTIAPASGGVAQVVFHDVAPLLRLDGSAPDLIFMAEDVEGEEPGPGRGSSDAVRRQMQRVTLSGGAASTSYEAPSQFGADIGGRGRLLVRDLDGDGLADLVFTNGEGELQVAWHRPAPPRGGAKGDSSAQGSAQ